MVNEPEAELLLDPVVVAVVLKTRVVALVVVEGEVTFELDVALI